ncbi:MAG: hypothetical protein COW71_05270 [Ignavibacteriales bacterium CG18_big_fil_WC_8_21_14_2_50_31_20]|nr:MAG: hypothetical protein COW71_05270 [Ignavibacteriales bacterium CG18_big_fil_WC_8_21_14_2_50_31_20]
MIVLFLKLFILILLHYPCLSGNNGLFAELVYHIVDRELDIAEKDLADSESAKMTGNNFAIQVGFKFGL